MFSLTRFIKDLTERVVKIFFVADRALFKIILVTFGLLLAKLFPVLISYHRGYYVGLIIIVEIYFITKIRGQKR